MTADTDVQNDSGKAKRVIVLALPGNYTGGWLWMDTHGEMGHATDVRCGSQHRLGFELQLSKCWICLGENG